MTDKRERVDVAYYTRALRGLYELWPNQFTMWFILNAMYETLQQATDAMLKIRLEKMPSQWNHLRGWMKEMERFSTRLAIYYENVKSPDTLESHVVRPVLFGEYPADMLTEALEPTWTRTNTGYRGRPDVTQVAMLYNQAIVALQAFEDLWNWWAVSELDIRLSEALMSAKNQLFEHAAPGEDPTMRDNLGSAIDRMADDAKDMIRRGAEGAATLAKIAIAVGVFAVAAMLTKE